MTGACIKRPFSVWTRCRCQPCRLDMARMAKVARVGLYTRASNDEAWAVLDRLIAANWSPRAIGSASATPWLRWHSTLREYAMTGRRRKLSPHSAAALLQLGQPTDGTVGAFPIRRRLQALAAIGWRLDDLAAATGIGYSTLAGIRAGRTEMVAARFYAPVVEAYERLHMRPGPSSQGRMAAARKGYVPPLAWLDIDDPDEQPDTGWKPVRARPASELLAEFEHLTGLGVSAHHAARQLGVTVEAVEKAMERTKESAA